MQFYRRVLFIRGGAIGDFLLTLPTIHSFRDTFPEAHVEIVGTRSIIELAHQRFYAEAVKPIDYRPMASFFGRKTELCQDLCKYFASFDLIISYLFDPDGIFLENLKQAGAKKVINGPWKPNESSHAILQLAKPLSELGAEIKDITIRIYPTPADLEAATSHLPVLRNKEKCIVIHPGSGAERKNWPIESWAILSERLLNAGWKLIFTGGEADHKKLDYLSDKLAKTEKIFFLKNQPLPVVAGALKLAGNYLGHDTGISHLAAGAGCKSILFFGPTNPEVWAPPNTGTRILRPASGNLHDLDIEEVWSSVLQWY